MEFQELFVLTSVWALKRIAGEGQSRKIARRAASSEGKKDGKGQSWNVHFPTRPCACPPAQQRRCTQLPGRSIYPMHQVGPQKASLQKSYWLCQPKSKKDLYSSFLWLEGHVGRKLENGQILFGCHAATIYRELPVHDSYFPKVLTCITYNYQSVPAS